MEPTRVLVTILVACLMTLEGLQAQQVATWTVAPTPQLSLGSIDATGGELFVSVLMATMLADGSIVMRNSTRGIFELRYFDSDGRHLTTASRWGLGPFEFQVASGVFRLPGDSIYVAGADDRFAVFGPLGERIREGRMGMLTYPPPRFVDALDSGHLVFRVPVVDEARGSGLPADGRQAEHIVTYDLRGQSFDTIATIETGRVQYEQEGGGRWGFGQPFTNQSYSATGGGMVWIGDSADPVIRGYPIGESTPSATIRLPTEPRAVTRDDRTAYREAAAAFYGDGGAMETMWNRASRSLDFPDEMPLYRELHVDRRGNLWVRRYRSPWEGAPWSWMVFRPDGQHVADVDVPESALPWCSRRFSGLCDAFLEVGEDYFLVAQRDELGVVYLRKFRIDKQ